MPGHVLELSQIANDVMHWLARRRKVARLHKNARMTDVRRVDIISNSR